MNQRFLIIFAAAVTLLVVAAKAGEAAFSDGGAVASAGLLVFGVLAAIGLIALARLAYLDGLAAARRRNGGDR